MAKEAGRERRVHYDAAEKECDGRTPWLETCEMLRMWAGVLGAAQNGAISERAGGGCIMHGMRPEERNEKMIKPAQLYKEKLQEENIKAWYKPENIFWNGGMGDSQINIREDNYDLHQFASVDKYDNIIGYISYAIDWSAMSAYNFGIISYRKGDIEFVKDLYKAICDLFEVYHMNRISWSAYADNPAIRGYRNFIKKHGGRECGYYRKITRLQDGKLHDSVCFEILSEEFHK